jgi:hypothetical protein
LDSTGHTLRGTIAALDKAIDTAGPNTKVIPGRGLEVVGRGEIVKFRGMIPDIQGQVLSRPAKGINWMK